MSLDHDTREATSTNLDDALAGLLPSESSVAPPTLPHQTGAHVPSGSLAPVDGVGGVGRFGKTGEDQL